MRVAIVASGSRGDVQPYIALGKGLKAAGHTVDVFTSDDFEALTRGAGLGFVSVGSSIEDAIQSEAWRTTLEGGNFLKILQGMRTEMKSRAHDFAERLPGFLHGADLMLGGMGGLSAFAVAQSMSIPIVQAYVLPLTPTSHAPSPLLPNLPVGGLANRLSFHIMRLALWQSVRIGDVIMRKQLGMPPSPLLGPFRALRAVPAIYGLSRHVHPPPPDWPPHHEVVGYWFLDEQADWQPPADLLAFLAAGPPPVYIGFGSMVSRSPAETATLTLRALELSGQRGVLAAGWGGLQPGDLPDHIFMVPSMPHSWLFPRMAAVVHHGGAGTTAAGLRAGVPSVVVPFMGDQPYWGKRVTELGVGPKPLPRKTLTAEALAGAITSALGDESLSKRAAALGQRIRAEDGIGTAVRVIEAVGKPAG